MFHPHPRKTIYLACVAAFALSGSAFAATDLAINKTATASSALQAAALAVDNNGGTRWESTHGVDPSWLTVDLGSSQALTSVDIDWEAANAADYTVQGSNDNASWTTLGTKTGGAFGARTDTFTVTGSYRYVRMYGTKRSTGNNWGYSIWSLKVFGADGQPLPNTRIQAEDYTAAYDTTSGNAGGQYKAGNVDIEATGDTGGGYNIGWIDNGEWLEYAVNVAATGQYRIDSRVAAWANGTINFSLDGAAVTSTSTGTTAGGQTYATVQSGTFCVNAAGNHTLRATVQTAGFNLNWFELVKVADSCADGPVDFGPNVKIYDATTPVATIQNDLNTTFSKQETNQFGTQRYAFLFKPGTYAVDANLGFYTNVQGLGKEPDQVTINGDVHINVDWLGQNGSSNGNATQNFWRAAENMQVNPSGGSMNWAAAQAVPFRRMHVNGDLFLSPYYGWASGGYFSDSKLGNVYAQSQQQWFTRNSELTAFYDILWNMTFVGTTGAPANTFPSPAATNIAQTPIIREKPYLIFEGGQYKVFVPAMRAANSMGTSWSGGTTAGTSLPISTFYIVRSDNASAASINAALAAGKNLLFTPGVYHINDTLRITRAETVVIGLGMATIVPDNGVTAMSVADVDGVKIGGILFEAGTPAGGVKSPALLQIGSGKSAVSHAANPTFLWDVFVRVGGSGALGATQKGVVINSNNVVGDHFWIWRADHGDNVAWDLNTCDIGMEVNGDNVTLYGLFSEHHNKYDVYWTGQGGRTYFLQNEKAYDVPNQSVWMDGAKRGYSAYKLADTVNTHEAWGLGSYSLFLSPTPPVLDQAYEVPNKAGVKMHNMTTIFLGAGGSINHVINDKGNAAQSGAYWQQWTNYP